MVNLARGSAELPQGLGQAKTAQVNHSQAKPFVHIFVSTAVINPLLLKFSLAIEDAVENRGLYRVFVSRLFSRVLDIIEWLSFLGGLEQGC